MVQATLQEKANFSLEQAKAMLPLLRLIVADIQLAHRELVERRVELHRLMRKRDGKTSQLHDDELEETKQDIQIESRQLDTFITELEKLGVTLRSAEEGIVNFPTIIHGRFAYFCWKLGELEIAHWHGPDETFADRKSLESVRN